jgi:hypothetical protein
VAVEYRRDLFIVIGQEEEEEEVVEVLLVGINYRGGGNVRILPGQNNAVYYAPEVYLRCTLGVLITAMP